MRGDGKIPGAGPQRWAVGDQDLAVSAIECGCSRVSRRSFGAQIDAAIFAVIAVARYVEGVACEGPMAQQFSCRLDLAHNAPVMYAVVLAMRQRPA